MKGDGNAELSLFRTRVLLEVLEQKQSFQQSQLFYAVRLKNVKTMLSCALKEVRPSKKKSWEITKC